MKKPIIVIGGILVLALLLAGAAFVGGRLLNGQGLAGGLSGDSGLRINPDGGLATSNDIQPAEELPQTPLDVKGIFDHRQNNSIFVGTGKVRVTVQQDQSGSDQISSTHEGPTVEIVVTSQTIIYMDVTMRQFDGQPPEGQKVKQVVEPGSLDDIGQSSVILAWGRKTGDRYIADVLVFTPPAIITK